MLNVQTRYKVDEDTWPPDKPKLFTPHLLIHHKGQHKRAVEIVGKGDIPKTMMNFLAPLENNDEPQFIMIDGAPGIGKSVLLNEIAFIWG